MPLLDTIKLPKKLTYLGPKLPKSNYSRELSPRGKKEASIKVLPSIERIKHPK
jgi:hypothetical protein